MEKENKISIQLTNIFEDSIMSRSSISILFDRNIVNTQITLDFNNILFLSRSAAQQLELEKTKLLQQNVEIICINYNESIKAMFNLAQNKSQIIDNNTIQFQSFLSQQDRTDFLCCI